MKRTGSRRQAGHKLISATRIINGGETATLMRVSCFENG